MAIAVVLVSHVFIEPTLLRKGRRAEKALEGIEIGNEIEMDVACRMGSESRTGGVRKVMKESVRAVLMSITNPY